MLLPFQQFIDTAVASQEQDQTLARLYAEVIRLQNLKDMTGVLSCVHAESFGRILIQQILEPFFNLFTLQYSLISHAYVGSDGEYTYYRAKVKIEKIAGPDFKNGLTENLVLYKQQQGQWKVWNRVLLTMVAV